MMKPLKEIPVFPSSVHFSKLSPPSINKKKLVHVIAHKLF